MNIEAIVKQFKKYEIASQCYCVLYTDYGALWTALREHFRGPKDLMDKIVHCEDLEEKENLIERLQFVIGPARRIKDAIRN